MRAKYKNLMLKFLLTNPNSYVVNHEHFTQLCSCNINTREGKKWFYENVRLKALISLLEI